LRHDGVLPALLFPLSRICLGFWPINPSPSVGAQGSCLTAAKGANSFPLERVDLSSRFRVEFPISGTAGNLGEDSRSARKLNFAKIFPLEKLALSLTEKLIGH
jgi:hypothetical protein